MKIISYISEEDDKLYDVDTMRNILKTSKSKVQREIKRNRLSESTKYKNKFLYSEITLFTIMEKMLYEKLKRDNGHRQG